MHNWKKFTIWTRNIERIQTTVTTVIVVRFWLLMPAKIGFSSWALRTLKMEAKLGIVFGIHLSVFRREDSNAIIPTVEAMAPTAIWVGQIELV